MLTRKRAICSQCPFSSIHCYSAFSPWQKHGRALGKRSKHQIWKCKKCRRLVKHNGPHERQHPVSHSRLTQNTSQSKLGTAAPPLAELIFKPLAQKSCLRSLTCQLGPPVLHVKVVLCETHKPWRLNKRIWANKSEQKHLNKRIWTSEPEQMNLNKRIWTNTKQRITNKGIGTNK